MSRFFSHTAYAEDQPLARTILTVHVLTRGITTGTILGTTYTTVRSLLSTRRLPLSTALLSSSSTGAVAFLGISAVALLGRMQGRENIEWKDRSWRLLENEGQLETDDWTYIGMAVAPAVLVARKGPNLGWRSYVGAAGLGSVVGMVGYMAWRYGVNGGTFPVRKTEEKTI